MREGNSKADEVLRLSIERFRAMFEGHNAIMLLIEPGSGQIVDANPAAAKFYGYSRDVLRRMNIQEINQLPPEELKEQVLRIVNKDQTKFIFPHRLANGKVRTVEVHSSPISFDKQTLLFSIIHDITERVEAEQKLAALSERRRHLLNLSRVIVGERNMGQLLNKVARAALQLAEARIAVCGHGNVNGKFTVGGAYWREGASPCPPEESFRFKTGGVLMELIQGKESIRLTQTQLVEHPAWRGLPENHAPLNGLLGARLIDENGQANGVIMVSDKINGEFTEEDEFFLRRLANMTSLALQHIKARQEVEQKAAELESRVQARTAELQQAYNVIRQNETLLQDLFENIGEGVVLFDIQGKVLKINKAAGEILRIDQSAVEGTYYDSPYWKGKITLPDETMLSRENLGAFLQMGLQQVQRNLEVQVQLADGSRRWLRGSVAPLAGSSSQVEGIIVTFADITAEKEFQREREQFSIRLLETQEQERKRIAYELHDDTAQYLSILKMQLGALIDSEEIQSPEIKEKLKYLERDADRAFNDVRRFSHELRPVALEHQGLAAALEQIVEDYNKLGGLCLKFQLEGVEPKLPEEIKLGFFRIAQEAVNNIRKHARASRAIIRLKVKKNLLEMSVSDNGTGFDVKSAEEEASNRGSLGMISMRERANLINADLKLESSPGKGTKVTLKAKINTP